MELQRQPERSQIFNLTVAERYKAAKADTLIRESNDEQIKQVLRYGIILLGIPAEKHGDELSKQVLLNHIKTAFGSISLGEFKLAFELAIEGKTGANTELYKGEFISAKFIGGILGDYILFKNKQKLNLSSDEVKMNNKQRGEAIISLLSEETKKQVMEIGRVEKKPAERIRLPNHDLHQKWLTLFDKLHLRYEVKSSGARLIRRYGMTLDIQGFFKKKSEQMIKAKERNIDKL